MSKLLQIPMEAYFWSAALIALLIFTDPYGPKEFSICLWHHLGITFCPGCGLGRSIALLGRGEIFASFKMHPLGIPTVLILLHRIYSLILNTKHYAKGYRTLT